MNRPYAVAFAGVPGSSKSIVAHFLSERFGLPIFNNDNIRFEVREDMRVDDNNIPEVLAEYQRRKAERRGLLIAGMSSFIIDGSVDRTWPAIKAELEVANYRWFIVDMELSSGFLTELYTQTGRPRAVEQLPHYMAQHEAFMAEYGRDVGLRITDEQFLARTTLAEAALRSFLGDAPG